MDQIKIKAAKRTEQGTGAVRRLRRTGMIPGSVMKMKKGGTLLIKLPEHEFMMAMRGRTGKQILVGLDIDGADVPALLREMQNDVLKGTPIHVDFSEVSLSEKVRVTIPIYLVGEATGVKIGGGVLEQVLRTVDIDCLPTDIPEKFDVDVTSLGLDQTLFIRDLKLGDKYTVVTRGELAVAVVKAPDDVPAAGAAAPAGAEAAAPEVIKKGKDEAAAGSEAKAGDAKKEEKK
ncbi:MAG: 50S ribosomal protein L25 [Kiritimatiellae bacterium]|nr:50S ribosomal protein L25 [Kiritimatiellia bacterium]